MPCDHRTISEGCRRHTAQWPCFYQLEYEMYNSQGKNNFQPLSSTMATLPQQVRLSSIREGMLIQKDENHDAILRWSAVAVWFSQDSIPSWSTHPSGFSTWEIVRSSWVCLATVVRIQKSCKFCSKSGNVEKLVSSNIMLPYGFAILYGGIAADLRNRAIFLK